MLQCPFCHFDNEDGALFCDQCKSDLSSVAPIPVLAVPVMVEPMPIVVEAVPVEAVPVEAIPVDVVFMTPEPVVPTLELDPIGVPIMAVPVFAEPVLAPISPVPVMAVPVEAVPVVATPVAPPPMPAPAAAGTQKLAPGAQPRLLVMRGLKPNMEYAIFDGPNFVGRADDKPVDIDLEAQEPPDRVWCSRQHCCIHLENGDLSIEDLNSSNGTFVNRARIYPGQKKSLAPGDVVQIGNVQMKIVV